MNHSTLAERLRGMIRPPASARATVLPPEEVQGHGCEGLGGRWVAIDRGPVFLVERRIPPDHVHGEAPIGEYGARLAGGLRESASIGAAASPPLIFFDLETTGLNGGAGSSVFLVGCGWFEESGEFVLRQYVLARAPDEPAMLEAVRADLSRAGALVSFNGKSFDAPALETRYALHRIPWTDIARRTHLDVLHPARRFWGARATDGSSCSLAALERQVLGVARVNDVAGAEIPWRYFQYIRTGDAAPLAPVLEHNRLDLLSLAGLTARLLHLLASGPVASNDPRELLAMGRAYAVGGRVGLARDALTRAAAMGRGTPAWLEANRWLAILARRARRFDEAAAHWHLVLNTPGCPERLLREASEALAVHHEHRARDLGLARAYAVRTLQVGTGSWIEAARYRLARLDRKMTGGSTPLLD